MITRRTLLAGATTGTALLAVACTAGPPAPLPPDASEAPRTDPNRHQVIARTPASDLVVTPDAAGALAASRALLAAATAVVVVGATPAATPDGGPTPSPPSSAAATPTATPTPTPNGSAPTPAEDPEAAAARLAGELGVPMFLDTPELSAELDRLQTRAVIAFGTPSHAGDREVVPAPASAGELKLDGLPARAQAPSVLPLASGALHPSLATVLGAAGLKPVELAGPHPGATKASTDAVRAHQGRVLGIGEGLGTDDQFADAVEVTRRGPDMPGGGVAPLPEHHMVALYGHPQTPALGMMGEQPPAEAVERLKKLLEEYRALMPDQHVLGAFEIIATVASSSPGQQGDFSYRTPINLIMPWVEAAEANDIYVVLDLQPGRTSFLDQAKEYAELLRRPHVGLALDPEWRLGPNGRHLREIGQVGVDEVNAVGAWLADFVRENKLPPKVFTLHQFQVRMIPGRERLDTSRPEVQHLVHVDGQGGQSEKQATWGVIKRNLPARTWLGWKNFEDEDRPMLTPKQTVEQVQPTPHFISYQ